MPCRLIVEGRTHEAQSARSGPLHMAVDVVLLRSAAVDGVTTLRFYSWESPTLSLGYFQKLADRETHQASTECDVVRRASGGGAILHDRELTYSFATPVRDRFGAESLYVTFHESLLQVLDALGVQANLHAETDGLTDESFLCFQRRASGDVIVDGYKVGGSAQRRWKNALLQHGSVLLAQSSHAPELPGLKELAGFTGESADLISSWLEKLTSSLKIDVEHGVLADTEQEDAAALAKEKFGAARWTGRR